MKILSKIKSALISKYDLLKKLPVLILRWKMVGEWIIVRPGIWLYVIGGGLAIYTIPFTRWYLWILVLLYIAIPRFYSPKSKQFGFTFCVYFASIFFWAELYFQLGNRHFHLSQEVREASPDAKSEGDIFFRKIEEAFNDAPRPFDIIKPTDWQASNVGIIRLHYQSSLSKGDIVVWGDTGNPEITYARYSFDLIGKKTINFDLSAFLKLISKDKLGWSNCLYFSVVVSTAVGSGEIVPVTDTARYAVVLQIFYGLLTVSILVNIISKNFEQSLGRRLS